MKRKGILISVFGVLIVASVTAAVVLYAKKDKSSSDVLKEEVGTCSFQQDSCSE